MWMELKGTLTKSKETRTIANAVHVHYPKCEKLNALLCNARECRWRELPILRNTGDSGDSDSVIVGQMSRDSGQWSPPTTHHTHHHQTPPTPTPHPPPPTISHHQPPTIHHPQPPLSTIHHHTQPPPPQSTIYHSSNRHASIPHTTWPLNPVVVRHHTARKKRHTSNS